MVMPIKVHDQGTPPSKAPKIEMNGGKTQSIIAIADLQRRVVTEERSSQTTAGMVVEA